jgi:hypothetical protein
LASLVICVVIYTIIGWSNGRKNKPTEWLNRTIPIKSICPLFWNTPYGSHPGTNAQVLGNRHIFWTETLSIAEIIFNHLLYWSPAPLITCPLRARTNHYHSPIPDVFKIAGDFWTAKNEKWPQISFFGLYDGHAGTKCAEFLKENLHHYVKL